MSTALPAFRMRVRRLPRCSPVYCCHIDRSEPHIPSADTGMYGGSELRMPVSATAARIAEETHCEQSFLVVLWEMFCVSEVVQLSRTEFGYNRRGIMRQNVIRVGAEDGNGARLMGGWLGASEAPRGGGSSLEETCTDKRRQ